MPLFQPLGMPLLGKLRNRIPWSRWGAGRPDGAGLGGRCGADAVLLLGTGAGIARRGRGWDRCKRIYL